MTDTKESTSLVKRLRDSKMFRWVVGIPVALVIVLFTASYFLDEPLRRSMEKKLNQYQPIWIKILSRIDDILFSIKAPQFIDTAFIALILFSIWSLLITSY